MQLIDRDWLIGDIHAKCVKELPCHMCRTPCTEYLTILKQPIYVKQKGVKEMDYTTLKIEFKDGGEYTYGENHNWEDWDMVNGFVIVKDANGKWIGMYNTDCIKSVMMG